MENAYKEIYSILKKVAGRFVLKNIVLNVCIASLGAVIIGIILSLVSRVIPIYKVYEKALYIGVIAIVIALFYSLIVRHNVKTIANKVDPFDLKERVSTAIEIEKEECLYKELLALDALNNLKQLDYKKNIPLIPKKSFLISLCFLLVVFVGSTLLPDPLKSVAEKKHTLAIYKKEEIKKVNVSEKKIQEDKKLDETQKKDLIAKLQQLKTELKEAKDIKEADKAVEKTAEKLALKKDEELSKDLKNLEAKLGEDNTTKKLSEALKKSDQEEIKKALDKLKEQAKSMDSKSKQNLKDTLSKASDSTSNSDLKEQLEELESSLSSGDENAINSSVDQIAKTVKKGISNENMNKAVAEAQQSLQGQAAAGQQQAQAQGQGQGQGQGTGQGQGSGQGQGAGGSGAGNGSSNGDSGVTGYGSGGIANKAPGKGTEKEYEKIFTPKSLGGTSENSGLTGKKSGNSAGSESFITDKPNAELGNLKPYDQVIGQYNDKAMESLNNNEIPDGMKDVIKGYFSSLE